MCAILFAFAVHNDTVSVCLSAGSNSRTESMRSGCNLPTVRHVTSTRPRSLHSHANRTTNSCCGVAAVATAMRPSRDFRAAVVRLPFDAWKSRDSGPPSQRSAVVKKMTQMQTYGQDCYHRLPILTSTKICSIPTQTSAMGKPPRWRAVTSRLASRFAVVTID